MLNVVWELTHSSVIQDCGQKSIYVSSQFLFSIMHNDCTVPLLLVWPLWCWQVLSMVLWTFKYKPLDMCNDVMSLCKSNKSPTWDLGFLALEMEMLISKLHMLDSGMSFKQGTGRERFRWEREGPLHKSVSAAKKNTHPRLCEHQVFHWTRFVYIFLSGLNLVFALL